MSSPMPASPRYVIRFLPWPGRLLGATGMVALLFLAACGHATEPAPPPVTLGYCGGSPQVRPDVVLVVCNTNDITAQNLVWSGWGQPAATARGSATVNLCAYTACASGDYVSVPIEMTVSKIMLCPKHAKAYSVLRYTFPHGSPFQGVPAGQTGSDLFAGLDQTVPPANQTVSLTC